MGKVTVRSFAISLGRFGAGPHPAESALLKPCCAGRLRRPPALLPGAAGAHT